MVIPTDINGFQMIFTNLSQLSNRNSIYYRFWANCILVNGAYHCIVFDIFRSRCISVSKLFYDTFIQNKDKTIQEIKSDITISNKKGFIKMLLFFVQNDFGIFTDDPHTLPNLSMEFDSPFEITNIVVRVNSTQDPKKMNNVIKNVSQNNIQSIQIYDSGAMTPIQIQEIGKIFENSSLECIHILTSFTNYLTSSQLNVFNENNRFRKIVFRHAPHKKAMLDPTNTHADIFYESQNIDWSNCGVVKKEYFITNQPFFIESHSCNTCLNRKVSIDIDGNIGNCPLMPHTFGNIKDVSLREVVLRPEFQRLWHITKDQIDVCKDCEYRYICTDCRHFIKDKKNIYSQPSKCGYNPYIAKWSDEEGYVPVEDCGTYSSETGFVPDRQRIEAINRQLERNEQLEK